MTSTLQSTGNMFALFTGSSAKHYVPANALHYYMCVGAIHYEWQPHMFSHNSLFSLSGCGNHTHRCEPSLTVYLSLTANATLA